MSRLFEHIVVAMLAVAVSLGGMFYYITYTAMQDEVTYMQEQVAVMSYLCNMQPPVQVAPPQGNQVNAGD